MLLLLASVSPEPPQRGQSADAISCTALCKQTLNIRRFTVEDNSQQASEAKIGGKIRINEIFIHILLRYSSTVSLFMGGGGTFNCKQMRSRDQVHLHRYKVRMITRGN